MISAGRSLIASMVISGMVMAQGASNTSSAQAASPQAQLSAKFAQASDEFIKESLAFSPVGASQAGYHQHRDRQTGKTIELDAQLDDLGPAGMARQESFYKFWQARLRKDFPISTLNPEDAADWRMMDDQISQNLLEFERIQSYRHNPTIYVELIGNALFLPLTQNYASEEVRLGHVLSRMEQIPRLLQQAREELTDADPIFIQVAVEENDGNVDLIENTVQPKLAEHPGLKQRYAAAAP